MSENVKLNEGFHQVCVWPGTIVEPGQEKDFEGFMRETFGTRVQFLEIILTNPSLIAPEMTGGRSDLLFAVYDEDIGRFAVPRLSYGFRWIEDVYGNGNGYLYPDRVAGYKCWPDMDSVIDEDEEDN